MSTTEMNSATTEENQTHSSVLMEISTPTNFAETTAADFGISPQSFIPPSLPSSNRKEKSRLAQLKARRRSNIGVRGSPETNSLIRFIAQQRMKTPPAPSPLQLVKSSPFQVGSSLRQKMASFQSLMGAEESEDGSSGGCITTRDVLSDGGNLENGKENQPPSMALPPNKKRRLGLSQGCEEQIREDTPPHVSLELEEENTPLKHSPVQSREGEALVSSVVAEEELPVSDTALWTPTEDQQEVVFDLGKTQELVLNASTATSGVQPTALLHSSSIYSLIEMKPTGDSLSSPAVKKIKKQVRFADPLPPELFDKTLPPSTPLQKGGTPVRPQTPGGALRSLLKTPQRVDVPPTQHTEISPSFFGASPNLSMPRSRKMAISEDGEKSGKIPFSLDDIEIEAAFEECILNVEPLNLNLAFNEEPHTDTDGRAKEAESLFLKDLMPPEPLCEDEQPLQTEPEAPVCGSRRRTRRKVTEDLTESPAHSSSQKRKLSEESEPAKRSSRTAAKTACGKMKQGTAGRRWIKKVDRSLYGSREYASKNPSLSPIRERLSLRLSLDTQERLTEVSPGPGLDPQPDPLCCNGNSVSDDAGTEAGDMTALNASTTPQALLPSPPGAKRNPARRTRRLSGSKVAGRAVKGRKVSVNDEQVDGKVHERSEDSIALDTAKGDAEEAMLKETTVEDSEAAGEICAKNFLETPTDVNEEFRSGTSFSAGEEQVFGEAETSSDNQSLDKPNHKSERKDSEQIQSQVENAQSISDSQHDQSEAATVEQPSLQPWQDDFNLEDVFKPVPTRGQRSVRRSLRNKSGVDSSCSDAGSAWLPHTSPETIKEARRRTRGRRLSAALLSLPLEETEETQATDCRPCI